VACSQASGGWCVRPCSQWSGRSPLPSDRPPACVAGPENRPEGRLACRNRARSSRIARSRGARRRSPGWSPRAAWLESARRLAGVRAPPGWSPRAAWLESARRRAASSGPGRGAAPPPAPRPGMRRPPGTKWSGRPGGAPGQRREMESLVASGSATCPRTGWPRETPRRPVTIPARRKTSLSASASAAASAPGRTPAGTRPGSAGRNG
jgi:hypothetical protein